MRQLRLQLSTWCEVKDGDHTARDIFDGHYSRRRYADGRDPLLFVGPGERLYTYVNPRKVRSSNPGYCFLRAGWQKCGVTRHNKLIILELMPREAVNPGRCPVGVGIGCEDRNDILPCFFSPNQTCKR